MYYKHICTTILVAVMTVRFIDLFCGIGSFHYSFKQLGMECVMACDISKPARDTYVANHGLEPQQDILDIKPMDIPPFDVLCAGFPCQPFSNIGKHKGFDDERGTLFFQIMKIVEYHQPPVIVLENVAALLNHDKGATFERMVTLLHDQNYEVVSRILKCSDYGIPQMRKRLFIVAVKTSRLQSLPTPLNLQVLLNLPKLTSPTLSEYLGKSFNKKTAYTIRCGGRSSPINDKHNWDGYLVNGVEYRLSVQDCLKLQGFDNFELKGSTTQQYQLLGNTIPTNLTRLLGLKVMEILQQTS